MTRPLILTAALICIGFASLKLVKTNSRSPKGKDWESAVSLSNTNSISEQNLTAAPAKTARIVTDERQTEMQPSTNPLFETGDVRWRQPIFEEPFAKFHDWAERYVAASASEKVAAEAEGGGAKPSSSNGNGGFDSKGS
jgi:hypothetical protein